jgi:hypothetical protein
VNRLFLLTLLPLFVLQAQRRPVESRPMAEPAVEFTTTSNASQFGISFVVGYQFTVSAPVRLTSLGAVLQSSSIKPVFGTLPVTMPVSLWDGARHLVASATVSASDTLIGHFNYAPVTEVLLVPGIDYTIAGLAPRGSSALSDVPSMVPASRIIYGGPRSEASDTIVFPAADVLALRHNYFGASFMYIGGTEPVGVSGRDRRAGKPPAGSAADGSR